jgi:hypothetical protein
MKPLLALLLLIAPALAGCEKTIHEAHAPLPLAIHAGGGR